MIVGRDPGLEDVQFMRWDVSKIALRDAKVLGQYVPGSMREPVADQEGRVFREAAVIEYQQELAALL